MSASRQTPAQLADAVARHRDGRPDKAVMSNEERRQAGLMTRGQAAEHEHLAAVPQARLAERVNGPVPDDIWGGEEVTAWRAWQAAGHLAAGCEGWFRDSRDDRVVCACGEAVPLLEAAS